MGRKKRLLKTGFVLPELTFCSRMGIFLFIVVFCHFIWADEVSTITLQQLLNRAERSQQNLPPYSFEAETLVYVNRDGISVPDKPAAKWAISFRKKGECIDSIKRSYSRRDLNSKFDSGYEYRTIWDGDNYLLRQQNQDEEGPNPINAAFSAKKKNIAKTMFHQIRGAFLEGRFWHNNYVGDWITVVRKAKQSHLSKKKKEINGHLCYLIEVRSSYGDYELWVDPESGYNVRQASITLDEDDLIWGEPMSERKVGYRTKIGYKKITMEIDEVKIKKIGDHYFPVSGTLRRCTTSDEGTVGASKTEVKRSNIQFNPDFESIGAFKLDLPNGTPIRHKEFPGIRFVWQDGKIVPAVDQGTLDVLDEEIAKVKSEIKEEAGKTSQKEVEVTVKRNAEQLLREGEAESQDEGKSTTGSYKILGWGVGGLAIIVVLGIGWYLFGNSRRNKYEKS